MAEFREGDRVRFVPKTAWGREWRRVSGAMATVRGYPRSHSKLTYVTWDKQDILIDGGYYTADFELAVPLSPFEERVQSYIRRALA